MRDKGKQLAWSKAFHARNKNDKTYQDKRAIYAERTRRNRRANDPRLILVNVARAQPCVDCGNSYRFDVMELDHVFGERSFYLSKAHIENKTIEEVKTELLKCEVRCPTCHQIRHQEEHDKKIEEIANRLGVEV